MQPLALPDMFERLEDCILSPCIEGFGFEPLRKTARAFAGAEYWSKQSRRATEGLPQCLDQRLQQTRRLQAAG